MSWQLSVFAVLGLVIAGGVLWFERSKPSSRIVAAVAALAALGVAGRLALAPIPNVVATTDVALLAGYTLGPAPGFAVGALSAVVSNFWLGQGPWTPWQMAGWGLVGIGGAMLATLSGRRLGRWGLAMAGIVAGLAYGALLDLSAMVGYGGEQSLERYLALSARAIPFNVAHALGNAGLMLAAGPAMVRMLDRYRERFDVRWVPLGTGSGLAAIAALLLLGGGAAPPQAGAAPVDSARAWMLDARNSDGGFGTAYGADSSAGMSGWAMLGLESAGFNPLDAGSRGHTPVDFLRDRAGSLDSAGDLERTILALRGAGVDPADFGGENLVAQLRGLQQDNGSYDGQVNLTAFAVLALRAAGIDGGQIGAAAAWLRSAENDDGGWGSARKAASEPDSTGAALQALAASPGGSGQLGDGSHWLEHDQRGDGGWSLTAGGSSNTQSTAWAVQGLIAAGTDPAAIRNDGNDPFDYLAARRAADGHYTYSSVSDQTPVWVTAQTLNALGRDAFPLAPVARQPRSGGGGGGGGGSGGGGYTGGSGDGTPGGGAPLGSPDFGPGPGPVPAIGGPGPGGAGKKGAVGPAAGKAPGAKPTLEHGIAGIATTGTSLPAPAASASESGSSAPSTAVLLGGLGALAAALGGGFLIYRRRLP